MIHQAGLVQSPTSHSFTAPFSHQLINALYFSSMLTERDWEKTLHLKQKILIFHTPTQWCDTCFDTNQCKALSKPHWHNKEHSGRTWELLSDGNKTEANGKIKVQRYSISADLIIAEKIMAVKQTSNLMLFPRGLSYYSFVLCTFATSLLKI